MSEGLERRDLITALAGIGTLLVASSACAQPPPPQQAQAGRADAPTAPQVSPALQAVIDTTASCARDGRVCLARCTDHLAAGMSEMDQCQRTVMNMLAVVAAMGDVAGFRNASPQNMKALALACAGFCRACVDGCRPHADHHAECKACMDSCVACAKACEAFAAA